MLNDCGFISFNYDANSRVMKMIDDLQRTVCLFLFQRKCCGFSGYADWGNYVPQSCCVNPLICPPYYSDGCLFDFAKYYSDFVIAIIIMIGIEIGGSVYKFLI